MERKIITEEDDEMLFQYLDEYIENMPLEVLEQARMKIKKENRERQGITNGRKCCELL